MRTMIRAAVLGACAVLLTACTAGSPDPAEPAAAASEEPAEAGTTDPATTEPEPAVSTDLPAEALLPASAWPAADGPPDESDGITTWRLGDEECEIEASADAVAMRTITQGDGEQEAQVGVQQLAVFADADAASAEAGRLAAAIDACGDLPPDEDAGGTTYVAESVDVGAQGRGLATDFYGLSEDGELDDALGTYLVTTRRGTAVTLVQIYGGESTIGVEREAVTNQAQAAWELMCEYDVEGC